MPQELVQAPELTAAVQDYAKAIYALETRDGTVSTTALAERLNVRPASVSGMLKKLVVLGLVEHDIALVLWMCVLRRGGVPGEEELDQREAAVARLARQLDRRQGPEEPQLLMRAGHTRTIIAL